MGNQYNICHTHNNVIDGLKHNQTIKTQKFPLIYVSLKSLNQFISDNIQFFNGQGKCIAHILKTDNSFQQKINQYPIQRITEQKKLYLPSLIKTQFQLYQGKCLFIDYSKTQLYIGQASNSIKSGQGILINKKGNKYTGNFEADQKNGQGQLEIIYPKRIYKGTWRKGKLSGKGQATYEDGAHYKGNFIEGKKNGEGILTFPDGAVYQGTFKNDLMHGQGILSTKSGAQISGEWKQGRYILAKPQRSSKTFSINSTNQLVH